MKVSELIEQLQKMPQDAVVVMSSTTEPEEDGFLPLTTIDSNMIYEPSEPWCGNCYSEDELEGAFGFEGADIRCIVLWPGDLQP